MNTPMQQHNNCIIRLYFSLCIFFSFSSIAYVGQTPQCPRCAQETLDFAEIEASIASIQKMQQDIQRQERNQERNRVLQVLRFHMRCHIRTRYLFARDQIHRTVLLICPFNFPFPLCFVTLILPYPTEEHPVPFHLFSKSYMILQKCSENDSAFHQAYESKYSV